MRLVVESFLFTLLVPGTVTVVIPWWILRSGGGQLPQGWTAIEIIGLVALVLGICVYAWCLWDFVARGRGIPAPIDHPKQLVVTGLYRYVRNPMYLGVLLVLLGETLVLRGWPLVPYTAVWFFVVNMAVVLYEEPTLRRRFTASYERYCAVVNRWLPRRPSDHVH